MAKLHLNSPSSLLKQNGVSSSASKATGQRPVRNTLIKVKRLQIYETKIILAVPRSDCVPLRHVSLLLEPTFGFFFSLSARQSFPKRHLRLSNQKLMPRAVFSGCEGVRSVPGLTRAQGHFDGSRRPRG